jgi:hypothetical protein
VENVQLKLIVADKKLQIRLRSWAAKLVTGPAGAAPSSLAAGAGGGLADRVTTRQAHSAVGYLIATDYTTAWTATRRRPRSAGGRSTS